MLLVLLLFANNVDAQSVGGTTWGGAYYCSGSNSGFISLVGETGVILKWESSTDSVVWIATGSSTPTQSYSDLTQTTHYRAIVQDGAFPEDTSTVSTISIYAASQGGTITGDGVFCDSTGVGSLNLSGNVGVVVDWEISTDSGTLWASIGNTTATLNHLNITNYTLYRARVQSGPGGPGCPEDTSTTAIISLDTISVAGTIISSDTICYGQNLDTLNLSGQIGNVVDWIFTIDSGAIWSSTGWVDSLHYIYSSLINTTWITAIVKSGVCPADTATPVELWVVNLSPVDAGIDIVAGPGAQNILNGVGVGTPLWTPATGLDDPNSFTPTASPSTSTTYILLLRDSNNCVSRDTVRVIVEIPVPDAFSPNNDGVNDLLVIDQVETFLNNTFTIYNRHGSVVYEKSPYASDWDGTSNNGQNLPDGVYYYVLEFGNGTDPIMGYVIIKR